MIHHINESGYTVLELLGQLQKAVNSRMGDRRILIGPVDGEDGRKPMANSVVGIEANTDQDSSELDICWLYPGGNEWA